MQGTLSSKTVTAAVVVALAGGGLALACRGAGEAPVASRQAAQPQYHCPMHPTYTSDRPGECPICGMDLVKREADAAAGAATVSDATTPDAPYYCPMHPTYTSDHPGECPICGMDLVRREPEFAAAGEAAAAEPVAGRTTVTLSAKRRQLLGVRSVTVGERALGRSIRTVGRVAVDERRVSHVHTKFEGYVEHLEVDFTGKYVRRGERLLEIYSPELVATQEEYLLAYRAQRELGQSGLDSVARGGVDLLEAARRRLLLWDIDPADIERLGRTGEVRRTLPLHAEVSGFVVQKDVVHGQRVTPADTLFDIADFSRLWVLADVYESDLPAIRRGMPGEVRITYLPEKVWQGPVTWIAPTVEEATRTVKVRLEVDNSGDTLKPDMFADVYLQTPERRGLAVPESAVIDTGERRLVFLDRGEGRYEPREVVLGTKTGDAYPVVSGLSAGDQVVVAANFLLDSESSLKAAITALGTTPSGHQQ